MNTVQVLGNRGIWWGGFDTSGDWRYSRDDGRWIEERGLSSLERINSGEYLTWKVKFREVLLSSCGDYLSCLGPGHLEESGEKKNENIQTCIKVPRKAFKNIHADSRCTRCLVRVMSGACVFSFGRYVKLKLNEKADLKIPWKERRGGKWIIYRWFHSFS